MIKNNYKFKNLLTTSAFTLALITGLGNSLAENLVSTGDVNLSEEAAASGLQDNAGNNSKFNSGDQIKLNGDHNIQTGDLTADIVISKIALQTYQGTFTYNAHENKTVHIKSVTGSSGSSGSSGTLAFNLSTTGMVDLSLQSSTKLRIKGSAVHNNSIFKIQVNGNHILDTGNITLHNEGSRLEIVNPQIAISEFILNTNIEVQNDKFGTLLLDASKAHLEIKGLGMIGAQDKMLNKVEIKSGYKAQPSDSYKVTISAPLYANEVHLINQEDPEGNSYNALLKVNNCDFNASITTDTNEKGIVVLSKDVGTKIKDIGAQGKSLAELRVKEDNDLNDKNIFAKKIVVDAKRRNVELRLKNQFHADNIIINGTKNKASVIFNDGAELNSHITSLGNSVVKFEGDFNTTQTKIGELGGTLSLVEFEGDTTKEGLAVYANEVVISPNKTVTLSGIFGAKIMLADATLILTDTANVDSILGKQGKVELGKQSLIQGDIGTKVDRLAEVRFKGIMNSKSNEIHKLAGNIYSDQIIFDNSKTELTGDLTFHGDVHIQNNTTFNLKTHSIIFDGGNHIISDNLTINLTYDENRKNPIIQTINNAKIDATVATLSLNPEYKIEPKIGDVITITLFDPLAFTYHKTIDMHNNSRNIKWRFDKTDGKLYGEYVKTNENIKQEDIAGITQKLPNNFNESAKIILESNADYATELLAERDRIIIQEKSVGLSNYDNNAAQSLEKINTDHDLTQPINNMQNTAVYQVNTRISAITPTPTSQVAAGDASFTAGDSVSSNLKDQSLARYGAWGSPFYSIGNQKAQGAAASGYKSKILGATLGFDTMANDTMTVGIALTYAKTKLKHQNILKGDTSNINTYMLSIYGNQIICDNYFLSGVASFGTSKIKNNAIRIGFINGVQTQEKARAKYSAMHLGGELTGGYHYKLNDRSTLIPTIGLSYNEILEQGYKETGTRNQNRSISKKISRKLEGVLGLKAITTITSDCAILTPEVHAYVRQALVNKNPKTEIKLSGLNQALNAKTVKASKTTAIIGTSLTAQSKMIDYSIGYDLSLAKKYVGHTGTLKVRVGF